jgi:hypothetical protein
MKTIKISILSIVLLLISQFSMGQISFSHSIGASIYASDEAMVPAGTYSPRINILQLGEELTVSAGTHLGLGLTYNSNTGNGSYVLDLPIMAEINYGAASSVDSFKSFGAFAGIGLGISRLGNSDYFYSGYTKAHGLIVNGGLRGDVLGQSLGLRLSYLSNFSDDLLTGGNVFSIGLFYNLGME